MDGSEPNETIQTTNGGNNAGLTSEGVANSKPNPLIQISIKISSNSIKERSSSP